MQFAKHHKIIIGSSIVIAIIILIAGFYMLSHSSEHYTPTSVTRMDLTESITDSGATQADQAVQLAFDTTGTVTSVPVKVGDHVSRGQLLGSIDSGTLQASLQGAESDVESAQAHLTQLQKGARPEEIIIYQHQADTAKLALQTALQNAYLQALDAIHNKTDSLFKNTQTVMPEITIRTRTDVIARDINYKRQRLEDTTFASWAISSNDTSNIAVSSQTALANLNTVKSFIDDLMAITNDLSTQNSGMTQAQIASTMAIVNGASAEINQTISATNAAILANNTAQDQLTLKQASSTPEDIESAQAAVDKAQSNVDSIRSQLSHNVVVAPFSGQVTKVVPKVGEVFSAGVEAFDMMSDSGYKVELQVPETDIAKVAVGNPASTTLDAYGTGVNFDAHVSLVDPAQTIVNGVSTYKVTISFDNKDPRILPGMTANATIYTKHVAGALVVPTQAIITRGTDKFVLVQSKNNPSVYTEQKIMTGITGTNGFTEVTSGLTEGDVIAGFGSTQS